MATADQLVAVLDGWLSEGVHEMPAHSNKTQIGLEFGWNGVAWCAETCSVAMKHANQLGFWTASVAIAISEAKNGSNGLRRLARDDTIARGDFVTFDWKGKGDPGDFHISTVVDPFDQHTFQTIGGNENDAVTKQWRDRQYVSGFIRPAYALPPTPRPQPMEDDDMQIWFAPGQTERYLLAGGTLTHILDGATVASLKAAGVPELTVDHKDIDARLKT